MKKEFKYDFLPLFLFLKRECRGLYHLKAVYCCSVNAYQKNWYRKESNGEEKMKGEASNIKHT